MTISKKTLQRLQHWGGSGEMGPFEEVMWRAEVDPRLRSTGVSLHLLDGQPDWKRVVEGHDWAVRAIPRFRQKIVEPAFGMAAPVWADDPQFDLRYHLRRVSLPAPGDERQLLDFLQTFGATPCDRARPPWEAVLIEGLAGGRSAYALKLHHAMTDGKGLVQLFDHMLSRAPETAERPSVRYQPKSPPSGRELSMRGLRKRVLEAPNRASRAVGWLSRQRLPTWEEVRDYADSARRVLAASSSAPSPLLARRSIGVRYDTVEIPLDALKKAAKGANCSLNDALLSGIIGGLQRYHDAFDMELESMPMGFPISLRSEDDPMGGNRFVGAQYDAPMTERDPVLRMHRIREFVQAARNEPAIDVMIRMMPLMASMPSSMLAAATAKYTTNLDVQVSNIPGLNEQVYLAGAPVTHHFPFGPRPGCAVMMAMISYDGRCCLGLNSDPAAVAEPELLVECLDTAFSEVCGRKVKNPASREQE